LRYIPSGRFGELLRCGKRWAHPHQIAWVIDLPTNPLLFECSASCWNGAEGVGFSN
jgi:hypothetical protein